MAKRMKQQLLFAETIISALRSDEKQDLVILIIPSHDNKEQEIKDQDRWASSAMELFSELYGGATAFKTFAGIYKCDDGRHIHDQPILIESYVPRANLEDTVKLEELRKFIVRMGRETKQEAVGLIVNSVFHYIRDY